MKRCEWCRGEIEPRPYKPMNIRRYCGPRCYHEASRKRSREAAREERRARGAAIRRPYPRAKAAAR